MKLFFISYCSLNCFVALLADLKKQKIKNELLHNAKARI